MASTGPVRAKRLTGPWWEGGGPLAERIGVRIDRGGMGVLFPQKFENEGFVKKLFPSVFRLSRVKLDRITTFQ